MDRDRWWRSKCAIYRDKLTASLEKSRRTKRVQAVILEVCHGLDVASKEFRDSDAHEHLCALDERVAGGDFSPAVAKLITKSTT